MSQIERNQSRSFQLVTERGGGEGGRERGRGGGDEGEGVGGMADPRSARGAAP